MSSATREWIMSQESFQNRCGVEYGMRSAIDHLMGKECWTDEDALEYLENYQKKRAEAAKQDDGATWARIKSQLKLIEDGHEPKVYPGCTEKDFQELKAQNDEKLRALSEYN